MKTQTKHNHLVNNISNNFITRWLVKKINQRMAKANSIHRLKIRYRKSKSGKTGIFGDVKKTDAKAFSLYLRFVG